MGECKGFKGILGAGVRRGDARRVEPLAPKGLWKRAGLILYVYLSNAESGVAESVLTVSFPHALCLRQYSRRILKPISCS